MVKNFCDSYLLCDNRRGEGTRKEGMRVNYDRCILYPHRKQKSETVEIVLRRGRRRSMERVPLRNILNTYVNITMYPLYNGSANKCILKNSPVPQDCVRVTVSPACHLMLFYS
jgi:hypothetical protein